MLDGGGSFSEVALRSELQQLTNSILRAAPRAAVPLVASGLNGRPLSHQLTDAVLVVGGCSSASNTVSARALSRAHATAKRLGVRARCRAGHHNLLT
jgi:hypothetical protein